MLINNANVNTMRVVSSNLYQIDLNYIDDLDCPDIEEYKKLYRNILTEL